MVLQSFQDRFREVQPSTVLSAHAEDEPVAMGRAVTMADATALERGPMDVEETTPLPLLLQLGGAVLQLQVLAVGVDPAALTVVELSEVEPILPVMGPAVGRPSAQREVVWQSLGGRGLKPVVMEQAIQRRVQVLPLEYLWVGVPLEEVQVVSVEVRMASRPSFEVVGVMELHRILGAAKAGVGRGGLPQMEVRREAGDVASWTPLVWEPQRDVERMVVVHVLQ